MQTVINTEHYTHAFFRKELKNRFLCEVDINGVSTVCYVPSSCHLSNFLKLEGKEVLLVKTKTKGARTEFALFAVQYRRSYIILNSSLANSTVENNIHSRRFSYLGKRNNVYKEHYVDDYKCDLFLEDTNTIIEIKSVISTETTAIFPTVFSERSLSQLNRIRDFLRKGINVHYIIVSLNPYVKKVKINPDSLFYEMFNQCVGLGMTVVALSCKLRDDRTIIQSFLPILIEKR